MKKWTLVKPSAGIIREIVCVKSFVPWKEEINGIGSNQTEQI